MTDQYSPDILSEDMTQTIRQAVKKALLHHQAVGNKVAFWNNGKIVVEIPTNIKNKKTGNSLISTIN